MIETPEPPRRSRRRPEDPVLIFTQGKQAAAALVRALATPDPTTQLAVAQLLIETHGRVPGVIERAKRREILEDPWPGEAARAAMLAKKRHTALRQCGDSPDADLN